MQNFNTLMKSHDFFCELNTPPSLKGDKTYGLPPYNKKPSFLVDKYSNCPEKWLKSEGKITSYFVPVEEGNGMWLDFNENDKNIYHVAIVVSIQGINPITGLPCNDAQLEQYIEECPKHKIKFGHERFCSKCNYKWPKQNYISTTGTPSGYLWIDGFRTAEGIVRQYILTQEKMRGVASNIIGKDRVFAIGISFFISKNKKPQSNYLSITKIDSITPSYPSPWTPTWTDFGEGDYGKLYRAPNYINEYNICSTSFCSRSLIKHVESDLSIGQIKAEFKSSPITKKNIRTKNIEIGAGAKINQIVYDDPECLDFWKNEPEAIICINYCSEKDVKTIIENGEINIEGHKDGFLQNMPVGNY